MKGKQTNDLIMVTKIFITAIVIIAMTGCASIKYPKTEQIPDDSKWIGGKDGGSWVSVQVKNNQFVKIDVYGGYYDKTSELLGSFTYEIICEEQEVTNKKVLNAILFSDGLNIEWNRKKEIVQCLKKN